MRTTIVWSAKSVVGLGMLFLASAITLAAPQKEIEECRVFKESGKRLECYDALAQRGGEKSADHDGCKESVLARLGGSLFHSFPRQRELW